jgi:hypothetical protein
MRKFFAVAAFAPCMKTLRLLVAATAVALATAAGPAHALEVPPDITKLKYEKTGYFKPGDPIPPANAFNADTDLGKFLREEFKDGIFNPSGHFNAYDTNVFEVLAMPFRGAGDEFADDPLGNGQDGGDPEHGRCSGDPRSDRPRGGNNGYPIVAGECFNHQLEYVEYYERTMMSILGKFGAFTKRYEFLNPSDPGADQFQPPLVGGAGNTFGGRAINPAVIVPGTGESDETIVIGAHYDKTNDGPAAAWDSQEGHAQMIRVAKLMADYWDAQNARPTATVKFIPWDGEESGTLGSSDYAQNVIPPGDEENKVRGYWNTDPCAGGYPAFRYGNRANRVQLGIQLANPLRSQDTLNTVAGSALVIPEDLPEKYHARINDFNSKAPQIVEDVFNYLDDNLETQEPDQPEIFVSTEEGATKPLVGGDIDASGAPGSTKPVTVGQGRPFLFSSDWRNFEDRGIPFFNPGPEITGPGSGGDPGNPDALVILHSPFDNLDQMNRYAGAPEGLIAEGWVKGMEMCSHLLAWGMLQPTQGGASAFEDGKLTAYYEALPNEAGVGEPVHFDATGSHIQTASGTTTDGLTYEWDFGDGSTGTGKDPYHRYKSAGTYQSKLTVKGNGKTATMEVPIVVEAVPQQPLPIPALTAPDSDEDGTFEIEYSTRDTPSSLVGWQILEAADYNRLLADDMEKPLNERWSASEPTHPDIEPWQESDSSTQKFRGSAAASGTRSYWTGVAVENFKPGEVQKGESILTLKEPLQVPAEAGAELTYNSLFLNESDDRGFVQVAEVRDGDLSWENVDLMGGQNETCNPSDPGNTLTSELSQRSADLTSYAGKKILVRFVYATGDTNPAASQPCGWYIDDVEIAGGTFKPVDRSNQKADVGQFFTGKYMVAGRRKGTYAYRVQGLYPPSDDPYEGSASNIRVVEVTRGADPAPPRAQDPPRTDTPPPVAQACPFAPKFRFARAKRSGRGLRFDFATLTGGEATIDVFQASRARKVFRAQRVVRFTGRTRSFTWKGKSRRKLRGGTYFARFMTGPAEDADIRRVTLVRSKGRFQVVKPHYRRSTCGVLRTFKLSSPAFGGKNKRKLGIAYRLAGEGRVGVVVRRGNKVIRRFRTVNRAGNVVHRLSLRPRGLKRGVYKVTVTVAAEGRTTRSTLHSRKL